jgi:hypothetical protein
VSTTGFGKVVRLDSRASVERVLAARAYLRLFMPRLEVAPPGGDGESVRALQTRVDRLADECGCGLGAAVALAALGAWIVYAVTVAPAFGVWGTTWRGVVVTFVGATAGKLVGIGRARAELRGVLLQLRDAMR